LNVGGKDGGESSWKLLNTLQLKIPVQQKEERRKKTEKRRK